MKKTLVLALLALSAAPLAAQEPLVGYSPAAATRERAAEAAAIEVPDSGRARALSRALSAEPHVAGTPAQARTRDYVLARFREMGIPAEAREYRIYLPHAVEAEVWRLAPEQRQLTLQEPPVPGDSVTALPQYPPVNGYSAAGDVSGEVVYVNYGLIEDYSKLNSLGISVRGRIAIARYGRSFRGIKAREAEKHGAIALLLYSDPADDGYARGDVYPDGPMRPAASIQRGSVLNANGDPATPGYASVAGAPRVPEEEMDIPRIPVLPLSYGSAAELLRPLRGGELPQEWQGGLPFRYHIGPGRVRARVRVVLDDEPVKPIWNTLATVRGSDFPDELVVIGGHRDAWGAGAVDNVSGTVSVLETARAVADLLRRGQRPRRTLVFATWDAEEWGLIGSTEHVEQDSLRLLRGGVAYLNQDVAALGPDFGAGGSPSLRATLRSVARAVPDPAGEGSVYAAWRKHAETKAGEEPEMEDPGGGSDFAGFYNHLGIPHTDWGFGGPYGVYHSAYDSYAWMDRWGDTSFVYHAAAARLGAALALRLANADVIPYDYAEFARTMRGYLPALDSVAQAKTWEPMAAPLGAAIGRMAGAAEAFATARDGALSRSAPGTETLRRTNAALLRVERALTRPEGLRTRPWFRSLIYAADEDNGYANVVFPTIREAIRDDDRELAQREVADLARRFDAATRALEDARRALGGR